MDRALTNTTFLRWLLLATLGAVACGKSTDALTGTVGTGGAGEAGGAAATGGAGGQTGAGGELGGGGSAGQDGVGPGPSAAVTRGQYLVRHLLRCPDCHSRRGSDGSPDANRFLAGDPCSIDSLPPADNGRGCLPAPNLTNHATGLQAWSDGEIEAALRDGRARDGRQLAAQMPYFQFRVLDAADLQAVIAFLRSLPGIDHAVGPPQPPNDQAFAAVPPIALADLPLPDGADGTARGRYLTTLACFGCHTPPPAATSASPTSPYDPTRAFSGGRKLLVGAVSASISANLTSDATGLAGWTVDDVTRALVAGVDRSGARLCPPMPSGPDGAFAGLREDDLRDIGTYLLSLPPLANSIESSCPAL